ncbi:dihydropteroate synthase [Flavicella sediminum]|uniref:dihydropteroate synthase n=1 Tax=Flavicella sediminum TaxID=2585141 RepID=UPI001FB7833D|nr:dihydropteroate synthase [Flavicella sediminum]
MSTINCKGTLIDLATPKVMGILNITPDSFFDGGKYNAPESILKQVEKMLIEGASFIDVGAYSSRPGATHISEEEELERIVPVIELLIQHFPSILISIDTFRNKVAKECIEKGACMINDISGGNADDAMFETAVSLQVPYILMHMQGTPQTMQNNPTYSNITQDILKDFSEKAFQLKKMGLHDLIFDVGFGFGKSVSDNYELLKNLDLFQSLDCPILTGISRKSMLYKPLDISAQDALNATSVAHTIALQKGSQLLRVHDVKEAVETIKILELCPS